MTPRYDPRKLAPALIDAMLGLEMAVRASGLDQRLIELVKTRASQINGCAFCIHMHTRDARAAGETEERLYLLSAWRESPLYTARERAALALTEALTTMSAGHPSDAVHEEVARAFTAEETAKLVVAIATINAWNRIAVASGAVHPVAAKAA
jgi:AhpD family alkylhydroperoxidase